MNLQTRRRATLGRLDSVYFREIIQSDPPRDVSARLRPHRLIRQARKFLYEKVEEFVSGLSVPEQLRALKALRSTLVEKVKIVVIDVASEEEAFMIFETLNDRGLRLSVPDLLLNRLMMNAGSEKGRNAVRDNWDTVTENLADRRVGTFLRHLWVSRYGDVKSQSLFRVIKEKVDVEGISGVDFSRWCADESENYWAIVRADKSRIGDEAAYCVDVLVRRLGSERSIPVLLSGIHALSQEKFVKLARNVLSLVVRHGVIANFNPNHLEDALYRSAREVRRLRGEGASEGKVLKGAKDVLKTINPSRSQLAESVQDAYLKKEQAKYIISEIASQRQSASKAFRDRKSSVEHIFPQNADVEQWPCADDLEPYVWHIGNLTLLEPSKNKDIGRKSYEEKIGVYKNSEYLLTEDIPGRYSEWTVESIVDRAKSLVPLIDQVWRVQ